MKLSLRRYLFSPRSTIGRLYIDDQFSQIYTLEDTYRGQNIAEVKIPHETCIPFGLYKVIINDSARFKRRMPLLLGVVGFVGIRMHPGNTDENTDGCILVGKVPGTDFIGQSRIAFGEFFEKLEIGLQDGEVWIDVTQEVMAVPA